MAQFPGCNKNSVNELMHLKIPGSCLMDDFADVVDRLLDGLNPSSWDQFSFVRHAMFRNYRSLGPSVSDSPLGWGSSGPLDSGSGLPDAGLPAACMMVSPSSSTGEDSGVPLDGLHRPLSNQHHADCFCRCCKI